MRQLCRGRWIVFQIADGRIWFVGIVWRVSWWDELGCRLFLCAGRSGRSFRSNLLILLACLRLMIFYQDSFCIIINFLYSAFSFLKSWRIMQSLDLPHEVLNLFQVFFWMISFHLIIFLWFIFISVISFYHLEVSGV